MKAKVALVDDDRNVLTSVSEALENEGYTVTTYSGGEEVRLNGEAVLNEKCNRGRKKILS